MSFSSSRKATHYLLLLTLFLGACSEDPEVVATPPEVKSINIFFSKEDVGGSSVGKAYSYSPSTGLVTELATINDTPDSIAVLDTDEEAPGYEFAAFAQGRKLKLIDYSKTATQRVYDLQEFSAEICGIYPKKRPADSAYDPESDYFRKTIDENAVHVALRSGQDCSKATDTYRLIRFQVPSNQPLLESRVVDSAQVFGAFLFNPTFSVLNADSSEGEAFWVSVSRKNQTLRTTAYNGDIIFEVPFSYISSNKPDNVAALVPPMIIGLSHDRVLVQKYVKEYDVNQIETDSRVELFEFTLNDLKEMLEANDIASSGDIFEAYFSLPFDSVYKPDLNSPLNFASSSGYLVYETETSLKLIVSERSVPEELFEIPAGVTSIELDVYDRGDVVALANFPSYSSLYLIPRSMQTTAEEIIPFAQDIEFRLKGSNLYINALNPSSILTEQPNTTSWVLAEFTSNSLKLVVEDAALLFAETPAPSAELDLLILSGTGDPVGNEIVKPVIAKFSSDEVSGIFIDREFNQDESQINSFSKRTLGNLSIDVISFSNDILGANYSANGEFGTLQLITADQTLGLYYTPESLSEDKPERTPKLSQIKTTSGTERHAINAIRVTDE